LEQRIKDLDSRASTLNDELAASKEAFGRVSTEVFERAQMRTRDRANPKWCSSTATTARARINCGWVSSALFARTG
jgi:hypothetical protein